MSEDLFKLKKIRIQAARSNAGSGALSGATGHEGARRTILVVDASRDSRKVLRSWLDPLGHHVLEASTTWEAFHLLAGNIVDLVLVDFAVPDLGGPGLCTALRSYYKTRSCSVFVVAGRADAGREALAILAGADHFMVRPLQPEALRARVHAILHRKSMMESADDFQSTLLSLAQAVEARDPATGQHCQRVSLICSGLGSALGLRSDEIVTLQRGAFLHDIGKIAVPDNILFKRGPLSVEEWSIMQNHTIRGERICSGMRSLNRVLPIIRSHHERWDGSGYPDGLKGEDIPLLARITQVADIFDALITDRPYKSAYSPEHAFQVLRNEVEAGWRDPKVVEAFGDIFPQYKDAAALSKSSLLALSLALGESVSGSNPSTGDYETCGEAGGNCERVVRNNVLFR